MKQTIYIGFVQKLVNKKEDEILKKAGHLLNKPEVFRVEAALLLIDPNPV